MGAAARRWRHWAGLAVLGIALLTPTEAAADEAFERRVTAELQAMNPAAVDVFRQANEARDSQDLPLARDLYAEVRRMAPEFVHATRRQCSVELSLGHRAEAISLCREAVKASASPESLSTLANALASPPESPPELVEAAHLADESMTKSPDDPDVHQVACAIALKKHDKALLKRCSTRLLQLEPEQMMTQVYFTYLAIDEDRQDEADAALQRALSKGLPVGIYSALKNAVWESRPLRYRALVTGWKVALGAVGGAGALYFLFAFLRKRRSGS